MSLVVPNVGTSVFIDYFAEFYLSNAFNLRLFSNNIVPTDTDTISTYTEVAGGGYNPGNMVQENWTPTIGNPSIVIYNDFVQFDFTDVIDGSGNIYGYFITLVTANDLVLAERFADEDIPFTPINGAILRIKPRITCAYAAIP